MFKISLKELNANGQLIAECKKVAFFFGDERRPLLYRKGDPIVCYLHYYNDEYVVSSHIICDVQVKYDTYDYAYARLQEIVNSIKG